jgi:hypothetical protein
MVGCTTSLEQAMKRLEKMQSVEEWKVETRKLLLEAGLDHDHIFNWDETPVRFDTVNHRVRTPLGRVGTNLRVLVLLHRPSRKAFIQQVQSTDSHNGSCCHLGRGLGTGSVHSVPTSEAYTCQL